MLNIPLISAVATAGLLGGLHCAGMCGGMATLLGSAGRRQDGSRTIPIVPAPAGATSQARPSACASQPAAAGWRHTAWLHAGRISTYGLMGAVVGLLGAAGLMLKPIMPVHTVLFVFGNLALIWLGLRLAGYAPLEGTLSGMGGRLAALVPARFSPVAQAGRHPFLSGMAWGCLPCGLVYGVLPFALLSGDAWSGAVLMVVFGLAALPHLLLAQGAAQWLHGRRVPLAAKVVGALALIGLGVYGLLHLSDPSAISPLFCITPAH
ncbi:sulfite exporter TauE/SafE family protein [Janthinobacterium sp. 17J80-10]|uniref:sulfite exporter TauE/SafE family protein n=1 Tax=Janthinobacterium sp. 17J80-10 TaxID=2497863 RepID=UPI0010058306|nr:sulfite exporter TauE/SafE family protein [Janthinobacterium sp. 17J80-10]QAU34098.1 sulfite exporter TauE/SafE family protein [Janthinobacterium sp. 17J80-10]